MSKMNGKDNLFTFTSRLVFCCFVIVIVVQMYHTAVADPVVEKVSTESYVQADSVMWSEKLKSVCFLDSAPSMLIKYQPNSNPVLVAAKIQSAGDKDVECLVPVKTNETKFVIGYGNEIGVFSWDGISTTPLTAENSVSIPKDQAREGEKVSCGSADVTGRLWVGTDYGTDGTIGGMIYSVDESGKVDVKLSHISPIRSIAWSLDNKHIYYADLDKIMSTEFDQAKGELIGNGTIIFDLAAQNISIPGPGEPTAMPGCMTVDKDGNVWIAVWYKSYVLKIDPRTQSILTKVEIPDAACTLSVMFVGPDVGDIYVTTDEALFHVTNTGSKAGNGFYEVVVNWPANNPSPPPPK